MTLHFTCFPGVVMMLACLPIPQEVVDFRMDRGFIYAIKDKRSSGTTLFNGRLIKPEN